MQIGRIGQDIQQTLQAMNLDGWLLYDCHQSNPFVYQLLDIGNLFLTRRFFYWIPQQGECIKLVPQIEPYTLDHLPGEKRVYSTWQELESHLFAILTGSTQVAMEYSPYNQLPAISKVDAGTVEWVKKAGVDVVSSANLLQKYLSVWTEEQFQTHLEAAYFLDKLVEQTWEFIRISLTKGHFITEYTVQQFMLQKMIQSGFITSDAPICAVNHNTANPHYAPDEKTASVLSQGDFILLDLWCKKNQPRAVYADITRVGVASEEATPMEQELFSVVQGAQEAVLEFIETRYRSGQPIQGWEVDQLCRDNIRLAGYKSYFIHRTGHSIGEEVHGVGANLDNYETHDTRLLLPGTCFSVEPGIYLPQEFGVRLEYDVYLDPNGTVKVMGGVQEKIECLFST